MEAKHRLALDECKASVTKLLEIIVSFTLLVGMQSANSFLRNVLFLSILYEILEELN